MKFLNTRAYIAMGLAALAASKDAKVRASVESIDPAFHWPGKVDEKQAVARDDREEAVALRLRPVVAGRDDPHDVADAVLHLHRHHVEHPAVGVLRPGDQVGGGGGERKPPQSRGLQRSND